jgi:predicted CXXCH cytochrome family protein
MEKSIKEHAYVHKPAVENCRLCHTAHSSDVPLQLKKTGKALCVECHENIGKEIQNAQVPHGALNILDECLNCHGAHTANMPFLLKDKPMNLCLTCHDKEVETPSGRKLQNIKKVLDASQFKHGPIREGDCMACHQTHGSSNFDLLKRYFPQSFYDDFDLKNYALCVSCHEQSLIMQERTTTLTRFRNGNLNLHYVHVHQEVKGRTCRVCHEVHGGNLPANVRKEVPFGKRQWLLPLNVELTETGGRCSGCHRPMRYDRVNPVDNSIQTEEKAETEKQNTGSGP